MHTLSEHTTACAVETPIMVDAMSISAAMKIDRRNMENPPSQRPVERYLPRNANGEAPGNSAALGSPGCCAKLAPNDRLRFEVGRNSTPALTR
jgi:hypothetical protein